MSWDRLEPNSHYSEALTVRLTGDGYVAVTVPPTVALGPFYAERHAQIRGKIEALRQSLVIPDARRAFMERRWPYWDAWAETPAVDLITGNLADRE